MQYETKINSKTLSSNFSDRPTCDKNSELNIKLVEFKNFQDLLADISPINYDLHRFLNPQTDMEKNKSDGSGNHQRDGTQITFSRSGNV